MSMIYRLIDKALKLSYDQGFIQTCKNVVDSLVRRLIKMYLMKFSKIDEKKILFLSFSGNYDCNPKYIVRNLLMRV